MYIYLLNTHTPCQLLAAKIQFNTVMLGYYKYMYQTCVILCVYVLCLGCIGLTKAEELWNV